MYGVSAPLCAFLGAGDETRTRDSLLGRRFALCAVAIGSISALSRGFLFLPSERLLSSYGVVNSGYQDTILVSLLSPADGRICDWGRSNAVAG